MTLAPGFTRREWLGAAAAASAWPAMARARRIAPSDRVNLAVIGAGGMGAMNMLRLTDHTIVAAADVDFGHVARSLADNNDGRRAERAALRAAYDGATRHADYRRMFDRHCDIDAVVIATPDHHHALAARMAMERGLHVFVQKPLTYTVAEGRLLGQLARDNPGLVTQMGNQGHSGDDGRRAVELIRGGAIGTVREVHAWTNRPVWPQGVARPPATTPPAGLDWDVWLGPATAGWGYHADYAHFNWRGWLPFGTGALGDMGAHLLDFPLWALEPGLPTRVEARHSPWGGDTDLWDGRAPTELGSYPLATVVHFEFGNAPGGAIRLTWYDGGLMPPTPTDLPPGMTMNPGGGVLYIGDKGKLMHETYGEKLVLIGDGAAERVAAVPMTLSRIAGGRDGHERNWIDAVRGQGRASSPFADAVPLNETMLLGIAALRAGQPIDYDGAAGRITNAADANRLLGRDYRAGWDL